MIKSRWPQMHWFGLHMPHCQNFSHFLLYAIIKMITFFFMENYHNWWALYSTVQYHTIFLYLKIFKCDMTMFLKERIYIRIGTQI